MQLHEYQVLAKETAIFPTEGQAGVVYCSIALAGEIGELLNKYKKVLRGDRTLEEAKQDLAAEIGDSLWYLTMLADQLDLQIDNIATDNIHKLRQRKSSNKIKGTGDNR